MHRRPPAGPQVSVQAQHSWSVTESSSCELRLELLAETSSDATKFKLVAVVVTAQPQSDPTAKAGMTFLPAFGWP